MLVVYSRTIMSLIKRGRFSNYDFWYRKQRYQGPTEQTNKNLARQVEAKIRSDLALNAFGIGPPKVPPSLKEFLEDSFLRNVEMYCQKRRTKMFYREKTARLLEFEPWRDMRISDIDGSWIEKYATARLRTVGISTTNGELRTLRKALNLALEQNLLPKKIKVKQLPGEKGRDFIVTGELELAFMEIAGYPLKHAAILILDQGIRPEECVAIQKVNITAESLYIPDSKTPSGKRCLPLTQRSRQTMALLCSLFPDSEWLFPGRKGKHYTRGALDNRFTLLRQRQGWPAEFVLYSFRHSFATRLADSGAHEWEIQALLGHADIRMSSKYIHPTSTRLSLAMKRKEALDQTIRGDAQDETSLPSHSAHGPTIR